MPSIEIHRRNCIGGFWGIPDSDINAEGWVPLHKAVDYHLRDAGYNVVFDRLRSFTVGFVPDDPSDIGGHGVPGTLSIVW